MKNRSILIGVVVAQVVLSLAAPPPPVSAATRVGGGCTAAQRGRTARVGAATLRCQRERSGRTVRFVWRRVPTPATSGADCLLTGIGFAWANRDPASFGLLLSAGSPAANRIDITEMFWTVAFIDGNMVQNLLARGTAAPGIAVTVDYGSTTAYTRSDIGFTITAVLESNGSFELRDSAGSTRTPLRLPLGEVGSINAATCFGNNLLIEFAGRNARVEILFDRTPV